MRPSPQRLVGNPTSREPAKPPFHPALIVGKATNRPACTRRGSREGDDPSCQGETGACSQVARPTCRAERPTGTPTMRPCNIAPHVTIQGELPLIIM